MSLLEKKHIEKFVNEHGWNHLDGKISKEFTLDDFSSALAFVVKVGVQAEKADHHPDINIHSWNKVKIELSTHDEGGITEKDISLATAIQNL